MDISSILQQDQSKVGRRTNRRLSQKIPLKFTFKSESGEIKEIKGFTNSINETGLSCYLEAVSNLYVFQLAEAIFVQIETSVNGNIVWINKKNKMIGLKFFRPQNELLQILTNTHNNNQSTNKIEDRRIKQRRDPKNIKNDLSNRRKDERRYEILIKNLYSKTNLSIASEKKQKTLFANKRSKISLESMEELREWVSKQTKTELKNISQFPEPADSFKGKIENPIGVVHIPLGIAGPLKINGDHANGLFYLPLATTEGALVTSYNLGSHIITRSGGANVRILKNELRIGPIFVFKSLREAIVFDKWLKVNFLKIKEIAESTSEHLELVKCETIIDGRKVNVNFHYNTGDAMGMNMACKGTYEACKMISKSVDPEEYWLRSNFNSNKKATANTLINGYGKTVTADVIIPRKLITFLNTTPEEMQRYVYRTLLSDSHAMMVGANGHFANAVTALYMACGQDVALVANSHIGISTCEVTKSGDLYFSAYLSSLLLGTIGGGTEFGTAKECLSMLGCYGAGKANKLAEIVAATALAGEISICASVVNGTYVYAHEKLGKNRPKYLETISIQENINNMVENLTG
jgi:hydroxymethylglutaryl-CoA reductase (NADPH)